MGKGDALKLAGRGSKYLGPQAPSSIQITANQPLPEKLPRRDAVLNDRSFVSLGEKALEPCPEGRKEQRHPFYLCGLNRLCLLFRARFELGFQA